MKSEKEKMKNLEAKIIKFNKFETIFLEYKQFLTLSLNNDTQNSTSRCLNVAYFWPM